MVGSILPLLTVTAAALVVPAFAALLGVERHRHVAPAEDTTRRVRVAIAATLVGLAALAVAALLGADVLSAALVAGVLAGSVLVWAPLSGSWAVRGVVVWALLVTAVVGALGWLVQQLVAASPAGSQILVTAGAGLLLLLVLARGQRFVRRGIDAQAGLAGDPAGRPIPVLRPLAALAALLTAGGVVVALTDVGTGPRGLAGPQAGMSRPPVPTGSLPALPSSAATPTISGSTLGGRGISAVPATSAPGAAVDPTFGVGGAPAAAAAVGPLRSYPVTGPAAAGTATGTARSTALGAGAPAPGVARATARSRGSAPAPRPGAPAPRGPAPGGPAPDAPAPDAPAPAPSRPTARPTTAPRPAPVPPSARPVVATRTPGPPQANPHRPAAVPPRGKGLVRAHRPAAAPRSLPPAAVPTFTVPRRPTQPAPEAVLRTPGLAEYRPNRPPNVLPPGQARRKLY